MQKTVLKVVYYGGEWDDGGVSSDVGEVGLAAVHAGSCPGPDLCQCCRLPVIELMQVQAGPYQLLGFSWGQGDKCALTLWSHAAMHPP